MESNTSGADLTSSITDSSSDFMGNLATNALSTFASGFVTKKMETNAKQTFKYIDIGLNVFMSTIVLLIILLMGFMYLHLENPKMACKLMTYFAFLSISLLSTTLVGAVVLKLSAQSAHGAIFGPHDPVA
jgi:hypothetical protein